MSRDTSIRHTHGSNVAAGPARVRLSVLEIVALVLIVLAVLGAAIAPSLLRGATTPEATTSIKVDQHDTLWEIATAHPVDGCSTAQTVELILDLNDMSESTIVAGQLLVVPCDARDTALLASN